jgi:hypothetical protein
MEELAGALTDRDMEVVDRQNLEHIVEEQNFQLSGVVSDETAKSIGKFLGADVVITGQFTSVGGRYRYRANVIAVETAVRISVPRINVLDDAETRRIITALTGQNAAGSSANTEKIYIIGDEGPAGGIIFYDKGNRIGGWRYLEAAPRELPGGGAWGLQSTFIVGTSSAVGSGKENTKFIVEAMKRAGLRDTAAQRCTAYDLGGYTDWFLPSREELNLVYKNLQAKGLASYDDGYGYWSSTQVNAEEANTQNFVRANASGIDTTYAGKQGSFIKDYALCVCPIRAF